MRRHTQFAALHQHLDEVAEMGIQPPPEESEEDSDFGGHGGADDEELTGEEDADEV